ncbi:MAG: hypothetical protein H6644_02800 [Caldilineaceae bacterium]|nr:hypothetical protein [Caldilineaceae bacterium]
MLDKIIQGADETITYATAIIRSLTEISTISNGAEVFGVLGLLLAVGVAIGFFMRGLGQWRR